MEKRTVTIHGKEYEVVASRVQRFRSENPTWSIRIDIVSADDKSCILKACIYDDKEILRATGLAHERVESSVINKTSHIENCETSAIGRALACLGYIGGEYASADELVNALEKQEQTKKIKWTETPQTTKVEQNTAEVMQSSKISKKISEKQRSLFFVKVKQSGLAERDVKSYLLAQFGSESTKEIPAAAFSSVLNWVANWNTPDKDALDGMKAQLLEQCGFSADKLDSLCKDHFNKTLKQIDYKQYRELEDVVNEELDKKELDKETLI
jgi:hypothetical protein